MTEKMKLDSSMTHGMATEWVGEDGVNKQMEIVRLGDGDIGVTFMSFWNGPDAPPMKTSLRLKQETAEFMSNGLFLFFNDLERWKVPGS